MSHRITPYVKPAKGKPIQRPQTPHTRAVISRREFHRSAFYILGGSALVAVLARIADWPSVLQRVQQSAIARVPGSLKVLEKSVFATHLGEKFQITRGEMISAEATLVEVTGLGSGYLSWMRPAEAADPERVFSMVFRGSRAQPLKQETYLFHNRDIGWFPLFIVPISHEGDRMYYEAIVNRLSV